MSKAAVARRGFCTSGCLIFFALPWVAAAAIGKDPCEPQKRSGFESGCLEVPADSEIEGSPNLKLYYERHRKGGRRPLVVLHGGPGKPLDFAPILRSPVGRMLLQHYDIVYFDQRGAGRSMNGLEEEDVEGNAGWWNMSEHVADIERIRTKLFDEEAALTLLGSSWGGYLGLSYALAHPEKTTALILGSFEASARSTSDWCGSFDTAFSGLRADQKEIRPLIDQLLASARDGRLVWRRGREGERKVELKEVIHLVYPFLPKARYAELAKFVRLVLSGSEAGQKSLDDLDLSEDIDISIGGSPAGEMSFCAELIDRQRLLQLTEKPERTLFCDQRAIAQAFQAHCSEKVPDDVEAFDVEDRLVGLKVPALLFAGRWDPIVPWTATYRTAARLSNARFLLIPGAHTPIAEGGACLARAIDDLARGRPPKDLSCAN